MRYKVEDEIFEDYEDAIEYCISEDFHEDDDYFTDWVNDNYDSVEINGVTYHPYDILDNAGDGNMYDVLREYCEAMNESDADDARYELRRTDIGDDIYLQGYTIEVIEDEYDDEEDEEDTETEDNDCNGNAIERTRQYIEDQNMLNELTAAENKKNEDELMSLFQVIR